MVAVDGGRYLVPLTSLPLRAVTLDSYFIDRTEVTNAEFKEFVDAGGYERKEWGSTSSGKAIGFCRGKRRWTCSSTPPAARDPRRGK